MGYIYGDSKGQVTIEETLHALLNSSEEMCVVARMNTGCIRI